MTQLKTLPVHLPSAAKQEHYLGLLRAINVRRSAATTAARAQDELFAALQSRAFSDQL